MKPYNMINGKCHCLKCNYEWISSVIFIEKRHPKQCPGCKSTQWMIPLLRKSRRKI